MFILNNKYKVGDEIVFVTSPSYGNGLLKGVIEEVVPTTDHWHWSTIYKVMNQERKEEVSRELHGRHWRVFPEFHVRINETSRMFVPFERVLYKCS